MNKTNLILSVARNSPADKAGIRSGDRVISVNGNLIQDDLDLMFYTDEPVLQISFTRDGKRMKTTIYNEDLMEIGITLERLRIRTCNNNCIFCFVSQLPKGLRRPLYLKDEDYRMSFLYGNYVTLSNVTDQDRKRIIEQKMSPLYISVHTTNNTLRRTMLGNQKSPDIMKEIRSFTSNRIRFHAQIVLCPGFNDGMEMERTLRDLGKFYPYMLSIAVVPVGLTRYSKKEVRPLEKQDAINALGIIDTCRKRFQKKYGDPLVYAADELYIKAETGFPHLKEYGDLPQIENGVGMVPLFLHQSRYIRTAGHHFSEKKFTALTGASFYPFLRNVSDKIVSRTSVKLDIVSVPNTLFGEAVTVTGLLTGRDIIRTLSKVNDRTDIVLIPDVVLRDSSDVLLDDVSIQEIGKATNLEIRVIEPSVAGLIKGMEEHYEH